MHALHHHPAQIGIGERQCCLAERSAAGIECLACFGEVRGINDRSANDRRMRVRKGHSQIVAMPEALCVTTNDWPAMASVVVRDEAVPLLATEYVTVPFPLPEAPPVIVTKLPPGAVAVHEQPTPVVTCTDPVAED